MKIKIRILSPLFLLITLLIGVGLRGAGLFNHVTYIDEILLLTKGQLIVSEQDLTAESLLGYVYKIFISKTTSYGPFQVLIGRLIIGDDMFSLRALNILRSISFVLSTAALFLFSHLSFVFSSRKTSGPMLLVCGVFACQMLQWLNAKQAHSYAAGPFAMLLSLEIWILFLKNPTYKKTILFVVASSILCLFQYQVVLFVVAMAITGIFLCSKNYCRLPKKNLILLSGFLLLLFSAVLVSVLSKLKGELMYPYWIVSGPSASGLHIQALKALLKNLFHVFVVCHLFFFNGENIVVAILGIGLFFWGVYYLIKEYKNNICPETFAFGSLFCFLLLWIFSFLVGKTPVSQTRHCMIFLAPILLLELRGLLALTEKIKKSSFEYALIGGLIAILSVTVFRLPNYLEASKEVFDVDLLKSLLKEHQVKKIVAWDYDYSKLRLFGKGHFNPENMLWRWNGQINPMPESRVALVSLGSSYPAFEKNDNRIDHKEVWVERIYQTQKDFDYEPAKEYSYGANVFKIWLINSAQIRFEHEKPS